MNVTVLTAQFAAQSGAERKSGTFVVLRVGQGEATTSAAPAIANTASWNQPFSFAINGEQSMDVELYEDEAGRSLLLAKTTVALPRASEPRAMTHTLKLNNNNGAEVATLYLNVGVAPGATLFPAFRQTLPSMTPAMGSYATYASQSLGAPFPPTTLGAFGPAAYSTGMAVPYTQPQVAAGGYTQTTAIPGGYTQMTTYPNGYAQTTQTSSAYGQPAAFAPTSYAPATGFAPTGYSPYAPPAGYSQATQGAAGYPPGQTGYARAAPFVYGQVADPFTAMGGVAPAPLGTYAQPTSTAGAYTQSMGGVAPAPLGTYAQTTPAAGAYTQTTTIPGGYAQATTYPNGYAQSSYTQSSSQVPPTTTVSYGPGNTTTSTTYSSSEASYQSSQNNYARLR